MLGDPGSAPAAVKLTMSYANKPLLRKACGVKTQPLAESVATAAVPG
jgi:hypothetical protein